MLSKIFSDRDFNEKKCHKYDLDFVICVCQCTCNCLYKYGVKKGLLLSLLNSVIKKTITPEICYEYSHIPKYGATLCICRLEIKRCLLLKRKVTNNLDSILKSRDITLPTKVYLVKAMVFPVIMLWMWQLDYKESWAPKHWCFWTVVLEKTLESPLDCKEIQPVHPKGDQS